MDRNLVRLAVVTSLAAFCLDAPARAQDRMPLIPADKLTDAQKKRPKPSRKAAATPSAGRSCRSSAARR